MKRWRNLSPQLYRPAILSLFEHGPSDNDKTKKQGRQSITFNKTCAYPLR